MVYYSRIVDSLNNFINIDKTKQSSDLSKSCETAST